MYKYEAVIFDLDGVICKTDKYHYLAWKHIADELNIEFNQEINKRLLGVSRMESFDIILEKYQGLDRNLAKLCFDRLSDCGAIKNEEDMSE